MYTDATDGINVLLFLMLQGQTPLHIAAQMDSLPLANLLLQQGAARSLVTNWVSVTCMPAPDTQQICMDTDASDSHVGLRFRHESMYRQ